MYNPPIFAHSFSSEPSTFPNITFRLNINKRYGEGFVSLN